MPCACSSVVAPTASVTAEIKQKSRWSGRTHRYGGVRTLFDRPSQDAADTLAESASGAWDIIFLDAERGEYVGYWPVWLQSDRAPGYESGSQPSWYRVG
jgi:predicted O-methyltransferase YrrM